MGLPCVVAIACSFPRHYVLHFPHAPRKLDTRHTKKTLARFQCVVVMCLSCFTTFSTSHISTAPHFFLLFSFFFFTATGHHHVFMQLSATLSPAAWLPALYAGKRGTCLVCFDCWLVSACTSCFADTLLPV